MTFAIEIAPSIILFVVVAVACLPAVAQGRMLLLGASVFYTAGMFSSVYWAGHGQSLDTVSFLTGAGAGAATGWLLGFISKRLRGDYFALATLCFAEFFRLVLLISPPFPGPQGIPGVERGSIFSLPLSSSGAMTLAAMILLLCSGLTTAALIASPWGAGLQSAHDNETAARTVGLPVNRIRVAALVYAGVWGGAAGALGVRYLSLADADTFSLTESIMVLVVVLLTGAPSVLRCITIGTGVAIVSETLRFVTTGANRQIAFGTALFAIVFLLRNRLANAEGADLRP